MVIRFSFGSSDPDDPNYKSGDVDLVTEWPGPIFDHNPILIKQLCCSGKTKVILYLLFSKTNGMIFLYIYTQNMIYLNINMCIHIMHICITALTQYT